MQIVRVQIDSLMDDPPQTREARTLLELIETRQFSLADSFVDGPAGALLKSPKLQQSDPKQSLLKDVKKALLFAIRLWSQRSLLGVRGLEAFQHLPFAKGHNMMALHQSQKDVHFDDDDSSDEENNLELFDGLPIRLVLQPAVLAYGNENGEEYSALPRVWSPAIVWLDGIGERLSEERERREKRRAKLVQDQAYQEVLQEAIWQR